MLKRTAVAMIGEFGIAERERSRSSAREHNTWSARATLGHSEIVTLCEGNSGRAGGKGRKWWGKQGKVG